MSNKAKHNVENTSAAVKSVIGLFPDISSAKQAVSQLRTAFTTEEINIIARQENHSTAGNDSIADGTATGGAIGGLGGLMMGAGALSIPGLGPVIAAGPLAGAISGLIGGGITGGLIDWGIPAEKSEMYRDEISSGHIMALIRTTDNKVAQAVQLLTDNGANNIAVHEVC